MENGDNKNEKRKAGHWRGRKKNPQSENRKNDGDSRSRTFQNPRNVNSEKNNRRGATSNHNSRGKGSAHQSDHSMSGLVVTLQKMLLINDDTALILSLSAEKNGFPILLDQQNIPSDVMCQIFGALAKASKSPTESQTVQLLVYLFMKIISKLSNNANFYREIKLYITNMSSYMTDGMPLQRAKHVQAVHDLMVFLNRLQETLPRKSFEAICDLTQLITVQVEYMKRRDNPMNASVVDLLEKLNGSVENWKTFQMDREKAAALDKAPDDFREISIYPYYSDILRETFVRKNVVDGKYVGGIDHYLDVQFRLLREDFIRPLRDGINDYLCQLQSAKGATAKQIHVKNLNVYQDVRIIESVMIHTNLVHRCKFDCAPLRNIRWEVSTVRSIFVGTKTKQTVPRIINVLSSSSSV